MAVLTSNLQKLIETQLKKEDKSVQDLVLNLLSIVISKSDSGKSNELSIMKKVLENTVKLKISRGELDIDTEAGDIE